MHNKVFEKIVTERLLLRRLLPEDAEVFADYRTDPRVYAYQSEGWESFNTEKAIKFIEELDSIEPGSKDTWFQIGIELKETGELIGDCGIHTLSEDLMQAEIGYTIAPKFQKKGYGIEAVAGVVGFIFEKMDMHRITATVDTRNLASALLLEKLGFRREGHFIKNIWFRGEYADEYQYAILRGEWKNGEKQKEEKWLTWAKQLQAIAQAGLEFSKDKYDLERFQTIRELSVEIMESYTDISKEKLTDLFCGEKGYQTPKIDVRAAVIQDNRILMVKESLDGCWSLPGGWADIGLSVKENIIKECMEEAGVRVKPIRIIGVLDRNRHNKPRHAYEIYKIFVLCEPIEGSFTKNIETEASGYYSLEELPELSEDRINKAQIRMCFEAAKNKAYEVVFD